MDKPKNNLIESVRLVVQYDCSDPVIAWHNFLELLNGLPGVTLLTSVKHDFPGGGVSGVAVLAESHAAIHTWPENGCAWLELATCGDPAGIDEFIRRCAKFGELISVDPLFTLDGSRVATATPADNFGT